MFGEGGIVFCVDDCLGSWKGWYFFGEDCFWDGWLFGVGYYDFCVCD